MIQERNLVKQVVLFIITLGIYGVYWFYVTSKEMIEYKRFDGSAGLWTVLLFVPFGSLYSYYKQSEALEAVTDGGMNKILVFLLWLFFSPAAWLVTQLELNKRAGGAQPASQGAAPAPPPEPTPEATPDASPDPTSEPKAQEGQ